MTKMKMVFLWLLVLLPGVTHVQAQTVPVGIEIFSGSPQVVQVDQLLAQPFVARVVRTDTSTPVAGVAVWLGVNYVTCLPGQPNCTPPPASMYGQFVSGSPGALLTDSQGRITAPPFRAGSTPGRYSVYALISGSQPPGIDIAPQLGQGSTQFEIDQRGTVAATAVPSLSTWSIVLLAGLAVLLALAHTRRARPS